MKILNKLTQSCVVMASLAITTLGLTSCGDIFHEHLEACPSGVCLRFVFDYNMEFANAFPSQVDCLTLLVYDASGNYVTKVTETTDVLADENWRMTIDLPAGEYSFIAYGGMECRESSFHFVETPTDGSLISELEVEMDSRCINANPGVDLHPLFYGDLNLSLAPEALTYTEATLYMMRDTHDIRILLQNVNGRPVNVEDYNFSITADNTLFNWQNNLLPTAKGITYSPWSKGQSTVGGTQEGTETILAYAEFSTSRIMAGGSDRLLITNANNGNKILSIPLAEYLLLYKSERYAKMPAQEYLDRERQWNMILFLQNGIWLDTEIVINDWIVRINNAHL